MAHSDTTGLFCLTGLRGKTQRLQILALGFAPVERFLPVGAETLLVELVPLRTLSTANVAPAKRARAGRDVTKDVPEFIVSSDPTRLPFGNTLSGRIRWQLSDSAYADSVTRRGSWRDVAALVEEAQKLECPQWKDEDGPCGYLLQAETVVWARAAVVGRDDDAGRRARASLARLRQTRGGPEFEAWAARIEALLPH